MDTTKALLLVGLLGVSGALAVVLLNRPKGYERNLADFNDMKDRKAVDREPYNPFPKPGDQFSDNPIDQRGR